jgi:Fe-S cluster assembly scaffold protein SufB
MYYIRPTENRSIRGDLPDDIKDTWDKLGIPAEKSSSPASAPSTSQVVTNQEHLSEQGVIFLDMDPAS